MTIAPGSDPSSSILIHYLNTYVMVSPAIARRKIKKANASSLLDADDELAIEEPLEISLVCEDAGGKIHKTISVTMRTPGNDNELALGFLFTEGIIQQSSQVEGTFISPSQNQARVMLNGGELPSLHKTDRNFYTTSSCGVCGKTSIDAIRTISHFSNTADDILLDSCLLYGLESQLKKQQTIFKSTGGLHASALFDLGGNFLMLREDVGRHNALDKLIGAAFLDNRLPLNNTILLLSGRASFELVQKAAMAGIKIIAAVGAPSSLAVQLSEDRNMTLIGFLRNKGFNIYSGEHRITMSPQN
jgi:FdhD protein